MNFELLLGGAGTLGTLRGTLPCQESLWGGFLEAFGRPWGAFAHPGDPLSPFFGHNGVKSAARGAKKWWRAPHMHFWWLWGGKSEDFQDGKC